MNPIATYFDALYDVCHQLATPGHVLTKQLSDFIDVQCEESILGYLEQFVSYDGYRAMRNDVPYELKKVPKFDAKGMYQKLSNVYFKETAAIHVVNLVMFGIEFLNFVRQVQRFIQARKSFGDVKVHDLRVYAWLMMTILKDLWYRQADKIIFNLMNIHNKLTPDHEHLGQESFRVKMQIFLAEEAKVFKDSKKRYHFKGYPKSMYGDCTVFSTGHGPYVNNYEVIQYYPNGFIRDWVTGKKEGQHRGRRRTNTYTRRNRNRTKWRVSLQRRNSA